MALLPTPASCTGASAAAAYFATTTTKSDVTGGVQGCQSSVMTTLPLARPCSTYASASSVWSNGNASSMTGRRWPAEVPSGSGPAFV